MSRRKGAYEVVTLNGDRHVFSDVLSRSRFISENPHLFEDLPLLEIDVPEAAEVGYVDPDHYKNRKYEVFDVMRDTQTHERHIGYLEGCVIKYMMRWDKKNDDPTMDLKKAKRYLEQLIKTIEEETQCCG